MKVDRYKTGAEWNNFYAQDQREYCIKENIAFLEWLDKKIEEGYSSYLKTDDLQALIDFITLWYQIRYPDEGDFENKIDCVHPSANNTLAQVMDYQQLMLRLSSRLVDLMECKYTGSILSLIKKISPSGDYETEKVVGCVIVDKTKKIPGYQDKYFFGTSVYYNEDGIMDRRTLKEIGVFVPVRTIEELLIYLEENQREDLEYSEIRKCVFDHHIDVELRKKILELVPLKLVYADNPSQGYVQSLEMIKDFNEQIPGLNLTSEKIDEIMSRDYSKKTQEAIETEEDDPASISLSENTFLKKGRHVFQKLFLRGN